MNQYLMKQSQKSRKVLASVLQRLFDLSLLYFINDFVKSSLSLEFDMRDEQKLCYFILQLHNETRSLVLVFKVNLVQIPPSFKSISQNLIKIQRLLLIY